MFITLTDCGRRTLASAPTLLQNHFVRAFGQLKDSEQTQLLAALQQLAEMMQAPAADKGSPVASLSALAGDEHEHSVR